MRRAHEGDLEFVAGRVHVSEGCVWSGAVAAGIDILTTRQYEPAHSVQHAVRVLAPHDRQNVRFQGSRTQRSGVGGVGSHTQHAADHFCSRGQGNGGSSRHSVGCEGESGACILSIRCDSLQFARLFLTLAVPGDTMFDSFRQSLNDLLDRATPPEERRAVLTRMKQTLVQARMGLDDLRGGVASTRQRLDIETRELETMRRRKAAATAINDAETVTLAEKYEALHSERAEVLRKKLEAQEAELGMVEREVGEMTAELKQAVLGAGGSASTIADEARDEADAVLDEGRGVADEIDAMGRAGRRNARESEAEQKLAELKRRMGK